MQLCAQKYQELLTAAQFNNSPAELEQAVRTQRIEEIANTIGYLEDKIRKEEERLRAPLVQTTLPFSQCLSSSSLPFFVMVLRFTDHVLCLSARLCKQAKTLHGSSDVSHRITQSRSMVLDDL